MRNVLTEFEHLVNDEEKLKEQQQTMLPREQTMMMAKQDDVDANNHDDYDNDEDDDDDALYIVITSDDENDDDSPVESYRFRRKWGPRLHPSDHHDDHDDDDNNSRSPKPSVNLLSSFGLIEHKNKHKFKKHAGSGTFSSHYYNMNFSSRKFCKKLDIPVTSESIDESKLDCNSSLVDQILLSRQQQSLITITNNKSNSSSSSSETKYSRMDLNLKFYKNSKLANRKKDDVDEKDAQRSVVSTVKKDNRQQQQERWRRRKELLSSQEGLVRAAASLVDVNAFQHVLLNLKHVKHQFNSCHQLSIGNRPFNLGKLEFIYDHNYYWLVKLKKMFASDRETLYQMKCVRAAAATPANSGSLPTKSASLESSSQTQHHTPQQRSSLLTDSISIDTMPNLNWMFSVASDRVNNSSNASSSYLSSKVIRCLKPPGWSKQHGRVFKQLDYSKINNDLVKLLHQLNCYQEVTDQVRENDSSNEIELNSEHHKSTTSSSSKLASFDVFKETCLCELILSESDESIKPICVYIVTILINIAGRVLVEIKENENTSQMWLFYTDRRLRPLGWAKHHQYSYINYDDQSIVLPELSNSPTRQHFMTNRSHGSTVAATNPNNFFKKNYYLECLYENKFYVARVIDESENNYFRIKIEISDTKSVCLTFLYHHNNSNNNNNSTEIKSDSCGNGSTSLDVLDSELLDSVIFTSSFHTLFPCKWCSSHNIRLEPPPDWVHHHKPFDWDSYYEECLLKRTTVESDTNNRAAQQHQPKVHLTLAESDAHLFNWCKNLASLADRFQLGAYLECAADRPHSNRIHLAQIKAKTGHLLFLHLFENQSTENQLKIVSVDSSDIFPVGWCEMNNYYSRVNHTESSGPSFFGGFEVDNRTTEINFDRLSPELLRKLKGTKYWINSLRIEMNCYHGPYLLDSKLEKLPKTFGPGPIFSVIFKLLQTLINQSEKPFKVIKLLQAPKKSMALYNPSLSNLELDKSKYMIRCRLRAKEKDKYIFREIDVCTMASQLGEYLNQLCIQLGCCTRMFSYEPKLKQSSCHNEPLGSQLYLEKKCCDLCSINHFIEEKIIEGESPAKKIVKPVEKPALPVKRQYKPRERGNAVATAAATTTTAATNTTHATTLMTTRRTVRLLEESQAYQSSVESVSNETVGAEDRTKVRRRKRGLPAVESHQLLQPVVVLKKLKPDVVLGDNNQSKRSSSRLQTTNEAAVGVGRTRRSTASLATTSSNSEKPLNVAAEQMNSFLTIRSQCDTRATVGGPQTPDVIISNRLNPVNWSISDVSKYLTENKTETNLVQMIRDQEVDGHSFLMLNLPTIQSCMSLKLGPAIKLTFLVEQLKQHYFTRFDPFQHHV